MMKRSLLFAFAVAFAAAASAQQYKWIDKDGKVRYGDTPPPGVKATPLKAPAGPAAPAAAGKKGGPLTPAEQEQAYRKRLLEGRDAQEKEEKERAAAADRKLNCDRAQEHVRTLESGQRIARTDSKGERVFMEDDERAREVEAARKSAAQFCK